MSTDKLVTCVWFDLGQAREAANFYAGLFPDSHVGAFWPLAPTWLSGR